MSQCEYEISCCVSKTERIKLKKLVVKSLKYFQSIHLSMRIVSYVCLSIIALSAILLVGYISLSSSGNTQIANAACVNDLTGTWIGNDGATYYIKQNGHKIWWAGGTGFNTGTGFTNVFDGIREGTSVRGLWADVPMGNARGNGELSFQCNQDANNDILTKTSASGGFSGSIWTKPKDVFKKYFTWSNLNSGDCTLVTAYINLYSNGKGIWHADVISDSDDDSWIVRNIVVKDANNNPIFTIPRFSSPTLSEGPPPFATGPGPIEDKKRMWNNENIQFPFELFDRIAGASLSHSC